MVGRPYCQILGLYCSGNPDQEGRNTRQKKLRTEMETSRRIKKSDDDFIQLSMCHK